MEYHHKTAEDAAKLKMKLVNDMHEFLKPTADIIDRHDDSQIASFYDNRSIFITGASGFVGKVSDLSMKTNRNQTSFNMKI